MKMKKIIGVCKRRGRIDVYDDEEKGRWIGCGQYAWSAAPTAGMNAQGICEMFDVGVKQQDRMMLSDGSALPDWMDGGIGSELVEDTIGLTYAGEKFVVLKSEEKRFIILNAEALSPWDGEDMPELYVCIDSGGNAHVIAMMGMFEVGVFEPESREFHELARDVMKGYTPETVRGKT